MIALITTALKAFLALFGFAVEEVQEKANEKENANAQSESNKIEADPVNWLNDHFDGGVSSKKTDASGSSSPTETKGNI